MGFIEKLPLIWFLFLAFLYLPLLQYSILISTSTKLFIGREVVNYRHILQHVMISSIINGIHWAPVRWKFWLRIERLFIRNLATNVPAYGCEGVSTNKGWTKENLHTQTQTTTPVSGSSESELTPGTTERDYRYYMVHAPGFLLSPNQLQILMNHLTLLNTLHISPVYQIRRHPTYSCVQK